MGLPGFCLTIYKETKVYRNCVQFSRFFQFLPCIILYRMREWVIDSKNSQVMILVFILLAYPL